MRDCLLLRTVSGFSDLQISRRVGMSADDVGVLVMEARRMLRRALRDREAGIGSANGVSKSDRNGSHMNGTNEHADGVGKLNGQVHRRWPRNGAE